MGGQWVLPDGTLPPPWLPNTPLGDFEVALCCIFLSCIFPINSVLCFNLSFPEVCGESTVKQSFSVCEGKGAYS